MIKLLVLAVMVCLFATQAFAVRLICDPPNPAEQVTDYKIYQDGVLIAEPDAEPDGSVDYAIDHLSPGQYEFTAEACNIWGCSDFSNPTLSPAGAQPPNGVSLEKD